jgi:lysophospholipase L1-like esterase
MTEIKIRRKVSVVLFLSAVLIIVLVALEPGLRLAGVIDFPLYDTDEAIGYIPRASQYGDFLRRNHYEVNERNQTAGHWSPDSNGKPDLLVLGDSLVWGGNPYDQREKLGPQLQSLLPRWSVWAVGASSWSVENESEYLHRNPDVFSSAEAVIWIVNTGDFAPASHFRTDTQTPRARPWSALVYTIQKQVLPKVFAHLMKGEEPAFVEEGSRDPKAVQDFKGELSKLLAKGKKVLVLIYPSKEEWLARGKDGDKASVRYVNFLSVIQGYALTGLIILNGMEVPGWNDGLYRDGIHPNPAGNTVLAKFLSSYFKATP